MTDTEKQALTASYFAKGVDEGSRSKLEMMVEKIIKSYGEFCEKDYDYFFDVAVDVFLDCLETFNPTTSTSRFNDYLKSCVHKRLCSTATKFKAYKRKMQTLAESMDTSISEDGDLTLEDMMTTGISAEEEFFCLRLPDNIMKYLDSLTRKQRTIALLIMNDYDQQYIMENLGLDYKRYEMTLRMMGDFKKAKFLLIKE